MLQVPQRPPGMRQLVKRFLDDPHFVRIKGSTQSFLLLFGQWTADMMLGVSMTLMSTLDLRPLMQQIVLAAILTSWIILIFGPTVPLTLMCISAITLDVALSSDPITRGFEATRMVLLVSTWIPMSLMRLVISLFHISDPLKSLLMGSSAFLTSIHFLVRRGGVEEV